MNLKVVDVFRDFISLFYPRCCVCCFESLVKGEEIICTRCMLEMPQTDYHLDAENPLKERLWNRVNVRYAMALFYFSKGGRVQHLLHALKYGNYPEIGIMLGKVYGDMLMEGGFSAAFDVIVPVPLHPSRKRRRGYNQSSMFAMGLSERLGVPFSDDVVVRKIKTETQTRKSKLRRWQNVSDIFQIGNGDVIKEKRVLLVDDVITTGATVEACGNVLIGEGCGELSVGALAVV